MAASGELSPLRILVVDDHVVSARALSRLLRYEGYSVVTAHTMAGALALLAGQTPVHVLLGDVILPDGDGCELLQRVRAFYPGRRLPAVAMSGFGGADVVERCLRAGYQHFLTKPLAFERVMDSIRAVTASGMSPRPTPPTPPMPSRSVSGAGMAAGSGSRTGTPTVPVIAAATALAGPAWSQ